MGDCCSINGLDEVFGARMAQHALHSFRKNGLGDPDRSLLRAIAQEGISNDRILEIGAGIGTLHLELIRAGTARAVAYYISSAYVEAAGRLARERGQSDRVEYRVGDFVAGAPNAEDADVVGLSRVICCYSDVEALLRAAAGRTRRICVLMYPRRVWWVHLVVSSGNALLVLLRKPYRSFAHDPEVIKAILAEAGLNRVTQKTVASWRRGPPTLRSAAPGVRMRPPPRGTRGASTPRWGRPGGERR